MSEEHAPYNAGHDPTVTLRLELGRMTDKANAFEAALRKEVQAVVAQEVAKAKACDAEIAKLKAEVERLRLSAFDKKVAIEAGCYARVNLEAKVERLIKAGDGMADAINGDYNHSLPCVEAWNAAKEGKPSV